MEMFPFKMVKVECLLHSIVQEDCFTGLSMDFNLQRNFPWRVCPRLMGWGHLVG